MDRFVVRTHRSADLPDGSKIKKKHLKQVTIKSLKGVVVIEDVLKFKSLLCQPDQTHEVILDCLANLYKKIPSRDVLKSTKIGHTVRRFRKHKNADIADLSNKLTNKWLQHYQGKLSRPVLDVKCDNETERIRSVGRNHLAKALQQLPSVSSSSSTAPAASPSTAPAASSSTAPAASLSSSVSSADIHDLSELIEREVFYACKRLIDIRYRRLLRKLVFALKQEDSIRASILQRSLTVSDFITRHR